MSGWKIKFEKISFLIQTPFYTGISLIFYCLLQCRGSFRCHPNHRKANSERFSEILAFLHGPSPTHAVAVPLPSQQMPPAMPMALDIAMWDVS
jgi:hypothetical protein